METHEPGDDVRAIEAVNARQFGSLNWSPGASGDWETVAADFHPDASLFPAARPARRQTVEDFVARMRGLAGTTLHSFREEVLGTHVHVFGNVALAVAACAITENDAEVNRGVEMLLLVRDGGQWRIVSQTWDTESPSKPIPAFLTTNQPGAESSGGASILTRSDP
jgi:ketosteroid isomerase-like protein